MHKKYNLLQFFFFSFTFTVLNILIFGFFNNTLMAKEKDKVSINDINTINTQISDNTFYFGKSCLILIITGFVFYIFFFYIKTTDTSNNLSIEEVIKLITELLNQELDAPKSSVTRRIGHINRSLDYFITNFNPSDFENLDAIIKVILEIIRFSILGI